MVRPLLSSRRQEGAVLLLKLYIHRDYLGVGADPHKGSPDTQSGGDDTVHIILFQKTGWVLPSQADKQGVREYLTIVGVTAEKQITSGVRKALQFARLVE